MKPGKLIYIVGPEGGGKRRLVDHARRHCVGRALAIFPRRYVAGGARHLEDCHVLSDETFDDWLSRDFFALHWGDGCCRYGVGREIDNWMEAGLDVVLVGDLEILPRVRARYSDMEVVLVSPGPKAIAQWAGEDDCTAAIDREKLAADCAALERSLSGVPLIRSDGALGDASLRLANLIESGLGRRQVA